MSVKLFITIDTEEDLWGIYRNENNPVDNVCRIPLLQEIFDRYGAIPTYLINYPVVTNEKARSILKRINDRGCCEIGTHCHPWNTPPFEEEVNNYNSMLCNLSNELQKKKINNLHEEIKKHFGGSPRCFRAGRWGFDSNTAKCIYELGYKIDTSVTPFHSWTRLYGPDFSEAPHFPYRFSPNNINIELHNGCLLEVPPTIGFFQNNFKRCNQIRRKVVIGHFSRFRILGILDRLKILNFRWLSPELSSGTDMILLAKRLIRLGYTNLNMSFHSNSLLPGKTPFVQHELDLEKFLKEIEIFLIYASEQGFTFSFLRDALSC